MSNVHILDYFHNNLNIFQWVDYAVKERASLSLSIPLNRFGPIYDFIDYLNSWEMLDRPSRIKCFNLLFNDFHRATWQYRKYFIQLKENNIYLMNWSVEWLLVHRWFLHWEIKNGKERQYLLFYDCYNYYSIANNSMKHKAILSSIQRTALSTYSKLLTIIRFILYLDWQGMRKKNWEINSIFPFV